MSTTYTGIEKGKNISRGPEMVKWISYWISTDCWKPEDDWFKIFTLKKQNHKDYEKENIFLRTDNTQRKKKNSSANNNEITKKSVKYHFVTSKCPVSKNPWRYLLGIFLNHTVSKALDFKYFSQLSHIYNILTCEDTTDTNHHETLLIHSQKK